MYATAPAIESTFEASDAALAQTESAYQDVAALVTRIETQERRIFELECDVSVVETELNSAIEVMLWPFLCQHDTSKQILEYLDALHLNPHKPEHADRIACFLEAQADFIDLVAAEELEDVLNNE